MPEPARTTSWERLQVLDRREYRTLWDARRGSSRAVVERWHVGSPDEGLAIRREMRALERIDHPAILRTYESGLDDGRPWRALEAVDAMSWGDAVAACWPGEPGDEDRALVSLLTLFRGLCAPLAWLAGEGDPHADLAPEWLVVVDGRPRLTGFDCRRRAQREAGRDDDAASTPGFPYAPPERVHGEPEDGRADLYALGVLLHSALTGRLPTPGARYEPPSGRIPRLPRALDALVQSLLAPSPLERPADARAVAAALASFGARDPWEARVPAPRSRLLSARPGTPAGAEQLDAMAVGLILAQRLGRLAVPPAFAAAVHRATRGEAFAVQEWLRTAVALEVLTLDAAGEWILRGHRELPSAEEPWREVAMPAGPREMLHRRLRLLPPAARALAAEACALEGPFSDRVWFEAAEMSRDHADLAARELRRRDVIERVAPGRSRFVHASMPEVLGVAHGRRARRAHHRRLALALERHEPESAAAIARHWREAREPMRAADWFRTLARHAAREGRDDEASAALAEALACEAQAARG